jgi:hypothetical protein
MKGLKYWLLGLVALGFVLACKEPSPLYGTWADNQGNSFSFFDDDTFNSKVVSVNYEGTYSLLLNTLTLNCTDAGLRIVTEWDIRGNILYLDWPTADKEKPLFLKLYKVSN